MGDELDQYVHPYPRLGFHVNDRDQWSSEENSIPNRHFPSKRYFIAILSHCSLMLNTEGDTQGGLSEFVHTRVESD